MYAYDVGRSDRVIQIYNPLRYIEWLLCCICLALAIYILIDIPQVHTVVKAFLILASGSYFFITLVDIIATCMLKPLMWTSWIMFSMMGALIFFLCGGFLIFRRPPIELALYIFTMAAFILTAVLFLMDTFCFGFTYFRYTGNRRTAPTTRTTSSKSRSVSTPCSKCSVCSSKARESNKANQCSAEICRRQDISVQYPSNAVLRRGKFTCTKESCVNDRCPNKIANASPAIPPSHGGTFHVSRDVAPVLAPCKVSPKPGSRQVPSDSPCSSRYSQSSKLSFEREGIVISKTCEDVCGNVLEETISVKSRTVSTSARIVPKQADNTSSVITLDKYPEKLQKAGTQLSNASKCRCDRLQLSPRAVPHFVDKASSAIKIGQQSKELQTVDFEIDKANKNIKCPWRPQSSPAPNQKANDFNFPTTVQHYYNSTCNQCGQMHPQIATVHALTATNRNINSTRDHGLPTIHENFPSSPRDRNNACPCPSPITFRTESSTTYLPSPRPCFVKRYANSNFDTDSTSSSPRSAITIPLSSLPSQSGYESPYAKRTCKRSPLPEQYTRLMKVPWECSLNSNQTGTMLNDTDNSSKEAMGIYLLKPHKRSLFTETRQISERPKEITDASTEFVDWDEHPCKDQAPDVTEGAPKEKVEMETILPGAVECTSEPKRTQPALQSTSEKSTIIDMTSQRDANVTCLPRTLQNPTVPTNTRRRRTKQGCIII